MYNASEISHGLKVLGGGSEWAGVHSVFRTGIGVGVGGAIAVGLVCYGVYHYEKRKAQERLERERVLLEVEQCLDAMRAKKITCLID